MNNNDRLQAQNRFAGPCENMVVYTTAWVTLVGNNFVRKNSNNRNHMTVEKEISRATK